MVPNLSLVVGRRWAALTTLGLLGTAAPALAQGSVNRAALNPAANAHSVPRGANVIIPLVGDRPNSATAGNVRVFSQQRGGQLVRSGSAVVTTPPIGIVVNPSTDFRPGETVFVTVPNTVSGNTTGAVAPYVYQFTAKAGVGPGTFVAPATNPDLSVGGGPNSNPYRVAVGDVDGDGDLDLVTANGSSNTVSVRLNDGAGNFTAPALNPNPEVGESPRNATLGDIDGDGDLDLIVANNFDYSVSVLRNNGTGNFTPHPTTPTVSFITESPTDAALADIDNDGDLDLLVSAEGSSGRVFVCTNDGTGNFSQFHESIVGDGPFSVAVGDVDGDGDLDLLTANFLASTVSVCRNTGGGYFDDGVDFAVGTGVYEVTVGDVDGDGDLDLLTANQNDNTVSVRLNDGTGTFSGGSNPSVDAGSNGIAVGDVDGDGDLDLLTANSYSSTVSIRLNNGTGTFTAPATNPELSMNGAPVKVALGDIDNDGDLDLLTANQYPSSVSVRLNAIAPTLTALNPTTGPVGSNVTLTGTGFTAASTVSFNGTAATSVTFTSATSLTAVVPTGATTGNVVVVTANIASNGLNFTVGAANQAPVIAAQTRTIAENVAVGTTVGAVVTASDPNAGQTLSYAITAGNTAGAFAINSTTGQLTTAAVLNYEDFIVYELTVQVTDNGTPALSSSATVTVEVTNVNEAPTALTLSNTVIDENVPAGSLVGYFGGTDPGRPAPPTGGGTPAASPQAVSLTYSLVSGAGSTDNAAFTITNGSELHLVASPNYEAKSSYSIRVRATDNGGLFYENSFTITITDVNEVPTALTLAPTTIAENTGANVVVGSFTTTDPDANNTFTYSLVAGAGSTDNALVNINGDEVRITADPDFETRASYAIRVRTTDQDGLFFERAFTLTITDVVETAANDAPVDIFLSNADVAEGTPGATVGLLTTADGDVNDTHTYTLVAGAGSTGNAAFVIVGDQLRVGATALDFEAQPSYSVRIRTTDSGVGNLSFTKVFTITVTDVAEDRVVTTTETLNGGFYNNLTIADGGTAIITGDDVTIEGTLLVEAGGTLRLSGRRVQGPGEFILAARGAIELTDNNGLTLTSGIGAVLVTGTRTYSPHAAYTYTGGGRFGLATGDGLPARVWRLTVDGPLLLTQDLSIREVLEVRRPLLLNGHMLTLLSNADTTALVINTSGDGVQGPATVQRYITPTPGARSYRFFSSPVNGTTVADFAASGFAPIVNGAYNTAANPQAVRPFPNVFGFDETRPGAAFEGGYFSPTPAGAPASQALTAGLVRGRGYSVYCPVRTYDFVGELNSGPVQFLGLTNSGTGAKAGWHLLGNPYPSPIDWDLAQVPAEMSSTIYVQRALGSAVSAYVYLTRQSNGDGTGTGTLPGGVLPSAQGFFAQVTAASADFLFTNALRLTTPANPIHYRQAPATRPTLSLTLRNTADADPQAQDEAFVVFHAAGASTAYEPRFDARRPGRNYGVPTLAAVLPTGEELAINGLSADELTTGTVVELLADLPAAGTYHFTVGQLDNLSGVPTILRDRLTGTAYDLATQPTVSFTTTQAGEIAGRFALEINLSRVTGLPATTAAAKLTLYPNPATGGTVRLSLPAGAASTATVLDAAGRVVRTAPVAADGTLSVAGLPAGVYAVRVGAATARLVIE